MQNRKDMFTFFLINNRKKLEGKPYFRPVLRHGLFVKPYVQKLLNAVAHSNLKQVKEILDENPGLLMFRDTVVDPGGNTIKAVTAYEYALGAADTVMAKMIQPYFDRFTEGGIARIEQEKNYKPAIDNMLQKPSYNFDILMEIIQDAPSEDITEELGRGIYFNPHYQGSIHPKYHKTLRQALEEFRLDFMPKTIIHGAMHFNIYDLQKSFALYSEKFETLTNLSTTYDKSKLFFVQVIGFIQRRLPAHYRQLFAYGIENASKKNWEYDPSVNFTFGGKCFTDTPVDLPHSQWNLIEEAGYTYVANKAAIVLDCTGAEYMPDLLEAYAQWESKNLSELLTPLEDNTLQRNL